MTLHPNELDLLDHATGESFPGDEEVAVHVAECPHCAAVVQAFVESEPIMTTSSPRSVEYHRAHSLAEALAQEPPEPATGQLWRAEWDSRVLLVLILAAEDATIRAVPIIEAEAVDDTSVGLDRGLLGWNAAVLAGEQATLPIRVLDRFLGTANHEVMRRVIRVAAGDVGDGAPIVSPLDERWGHRVQIHENLIALSDASWVPRTAEVNLVQLLRSEWNRPSELAHDLGITSGQATAILAGDRQLNEEQRRVVEHRIGRRIGPAAPPDGLVWAIDHPAIRPIWQAKARRLGTQDSAAFRWATYTDSNFALAARTTGGLSERERLLARVKQVLDDGA